MYHVIVTFDEPKLSGSGESAMINGSDAAAKTRKDTDEMRRHLLVRAPLSILGVVFLLAAVLKAVDVAAFIEQIPYYGVIPADAAQAVALAAIMGEALLGVALLRRWCPGLLLPLTLLLLLGFTGLIGYAWAYRGLENCGCFGRFIEMTPGVAMAKNGALMLVTFFGWVSWRREKALFRAGIEGRRAWRRGFGAGCVSGIFFAIAAAVSAIVAGSYLSREYVIESMAARFPVPVLPGTALASDWELETLDGETRSFASFRGKVCVLVIFSSQCPECLAQLPSIDRLYAKTAPRGVTFVCVATKKDARLRQLLERERYAFPVYAFKNELPPFFKNGKMPVVYILSPEGTVVYQHFGGLKWDDDSCVAFLDKLASAPEPPASPPAP